jgi:drug/metabolite transporter (DMT)-like permease
VHLCLPYVTTKKAYFYLHISILLWGFTGIFGRAIQLEEGVLVWYRLLFAVPGMYLAARYFTTFKRLPFRDVVKVSKVGFIIVMHWLCFYGAIKYSNVSVSVSCLSTVAVFTVLIETILHKKKMNISELLLALLSVFGMYLIFTFQQIYLKGIILGLFAAAFASYFTILNKKLTDEYDSYALSFYELLTGMIYLSILMPLYLFIFPTNKIIPSGNEWLMLFVFSIFCTVIPFNLSLKALQKLSAFTSNLSINLEPVYGIILAIFIFKEQRELSPGFYIGTSIILFAVILYMWMKHREAIHSYVKSKTRRKFSDGLGKY